MTKRESFGIKKYDNIKILNNFRFFSQSISWIADTGGWARLYFNSAPTLGQIFCNSGKHLQMSKLLCVRPGRSPLTPYPGL